MPILARFGDASQGRTWLYRSARELQERDAPGDDAGGGDALAAEGLTHEARADDRDQDDAGLGLAREREAKARAGIIKEFTGISDPYEAPENPEMRIDTAELTPDLAAHRILIKLESLGFIR